jgi:glycosyltransferase involved in cell wall biosynthesis
MSKDQATKEMSNAGCLLLPLKDAPAFRLTVPSKVFDYMALSRPIISNISGEGAKIIARSSANIVVKPSNLDDFSNAILNIRKNWATYYKDSIKNHQIIVNEFTREKEVKELEKILLRAAVINNK